MASLTAQLQDPSLRQTNPRQLTCLCMRIIAILEGEGEGVGGNALNGVSTIRMASLRLAAKSSQ